MQSAGRERERICCIDSIVLYNDTGINRNTWQLMLPGLRCTLDSPAADTLYPQHTRNAADVHFEEGECIKGRETCLQAHSSVNPSATMNKLKAFLFLLSIVSVVRVKEAASVDAASGQSSVPVKEEKGFFKSLLDKIWSSNEQESQSLGSVSIEEEPVVSEKLIDRSEDEDTKMIVDQFLMDDILNLDPNGNLVNNSNFAIERIYEVRSLPVQGDQ